MRLSVAQAAPILANLGNLAIAEQRAGTDELTGLANQRSANDAVKRMAAEATADAPLAAIVLDLDHFKQINDLYGHGAGDEVLAAVGAALRTTLRPDDFCSRWGGEEFLLLLPGTDTEGARSAAENLRAAVGGIRVASVHREISASLGVAVLPVHAADAIGVVRSADRALYAAKAAGRNRVEVFTDGHSNGAAVAAEIAAPAR
jgi:diguanylate cyclase (GGDEF)-like protein